MNIIKKIMLIAAGIIILNFVVDQFSSRDAKRNAGKTSAGSQKNIIAESAAENENELDEIQKRLIEEYKAKEKEQFQAFLRKHLSNLKHEDLECAGKAVSDLYCRIIAYKCKARSFAEEVSSVRWCMAKNHEVRACFEKHVFGEQVLNNMITDAVKDFASKSAANRSRFNEGIISEMKAGHYKYLAGNELNRVASTCMANYNINFDPVLCKVEFRDYAFYLGGGFAGGIAASAITEYILGRVLALLAARAAILAGSAGCSWFTFGVSIVVGYAVDSYAAEQFTKDVERASVACIQKAADDATGIFKKEIIEKLKSEFVAVP